MEAEPSRSQQLIANFEKFGADAVLASIRMSSPEDYKRYGYAAGTEKEPGVLSIDKFVEKPGPGTINSDYAVIGGAVYNPDMFNAIEEAMHRLEKEKSSRELVYVDAVNILLEQKKQCYAAEIIGGKFHDCGNKLEYLKTVIEFGLKHEDLKDEFGAYLKGLQI